MLQIFIIPTSQPILIGLYKDYHLLEEYTLQAQLSESLIPFFSKLKQQKKDFESLYFVRGPGSFMALKLIYLFAKTMQITQNINLFGAMGFHFNENSPIKAYGNCYFIKEKNQVILKNFSTPPKTKPYALPKQLNPNFFSQEIEPLYLLPPV